jgi:hypothetical protein
VDGARFVERTLTAPCANLACQTPPPQITALKTVETEGTTPKIVLQFCLRCAPAFASVGAGLG